MWRIRIASVILLFLYGFGYQKTKQYVVILCDNFTCGAALKWQWFY